MFFVNDDEPQACKGHFFAEEFVSAYGNVDRAVLKALQSRRRFFAGTEPREFGDLNGPRRKAVAEGLGVLFRKKRRGAENDDLFAVHRRYKRRAQCYFGFPESHVAADQTIHRAGLRHILDYGGDGRGLIRGLFKGEAFTECLVFGGVL